MSQIFFCLLPGVNGYGSVCHEPFPISNISSRFFRRRGEGCHFRFRAPANHLASLSFSLPVSGDLRLLSTNTCWYPLCDLHSFLTVTFLTGCHCSFQREDSINLISIVSVGYHVTIPNHIWSWTGRQPKHWMRGANNPLSHPTEKKTRFFYSQKLWIWWCWLLLNSANDSS